MEYRIINSHTHVFPEKIAQKAANSIGNFYNYAPKNNASVENLLLDSEGFNVTNYLICSAAVTPAQTENINNYMSELNKEEKFVAFGTVHPENQNWSEELERIKCLGLHGVKLHPDFQKFDLDEDRMIKIYKKIALLGLPILFHMGDKVSDGSSPERLKNVISKVPDVVCIAAHMGGYSRWDEAYEFLPVCENLYFDTSSALGFMSTDTALKIIEKHGVKKFLFGTDFPIWSTADEYKNILSLGLGESENKAIFSENFINLFRIM